VSLCAFLAFFPADSISTAAGAAGGTTSTAIWSKNGPSLLLLSISTYFRGEADLAGDSKEFSNADY
jgi:hypothetical protein